MVAPWLRLDRVMVGDGWEVLGCGTATGEPWEHSPVLADIVLQDG
jgi:hypothetical protein